MEPIPADGYSPINRALLSARLRARRSTEDAPHVDLPALVPRLDVPNSQLLFGRQGAGKSHLLLTLQRETQDQLPIYIDVKNIGATPDLFEEQSQADLSTRATRLAIDVLAAVHSDVYSHAVETDTLDEQMAMRLDRLADSISQVRVSGTEERSEVVESRRSAAAGANAQIEAGTSGIGARIGIDRTDNADENASTAITQRGHADVWLHLASVRRALEELTDMSGSVLMLIDDWSSVPLELQPWLADLIRRIFWDTPGYVVKIAAVAAESRFLINTDAGIVGLNQNDASVLSLEGPAEADIYRAPEFVMQLLYEHALHATLSSSRRSELPNTAEDFARAAFKPAAFKALVEASEGNPRDALAIGAQAATIARSKPIEERHILDASMGLLIDHKDLAATNEVLANWMAKKVCTPSSRSFYVERSTGGVPSVLQPMYNARLVHRGSGVLSRAPEHGFTSIFEEWRVDYSFAAYLGETNAGSVSPPPPPVPYKDIDEAPVLRTDDFQQTSTWLIEPREQGLGAHGVEEAWANGPPAWVRTVVKGLAPSGDYLIIDAGSAVEAVPLERSPIGIGRASSDIRIVDHTVSREHAKFYKSGDTWRVVDQDSRNGVRINRVRKPWHELSSGDTMMLGGVVVFFVRVDSNES